MPRGSSILFLSSCHTAAAFGSANHFVLSPSTSTPVAGVPFDVTVTAEDAFGNVATDYTGTVTLITSDPQVGEYFYQFGPADAGTTTFTITLYTSGLQSITASDGALTGTGSVTVAPGAPTFLGDYKRRYRNCRCAF